jgi:uncharacterized membrane protein
MSLESGKNLAGIGALLLVIGSFVPFLSIVGIILFYIGLKGLGQAYNDRLIFQDALYALIFGIIGGIVLGLGLVSFFFGFAVIPLAAGAGFLGFSLLSLVFFVLAFVFYLLMAIYFRRSFDILATRSGVGLFRTAGLILLIGAILTIIFFGLILIFIAWILVTVAIFQIPTTSMQPQSQMPPPPPQ